MLDRAAARFPGRTAVGARFPLTGSGKVQEFKQKAYGEA
jgi:hypothetical protein